MKLYGEWSVKLPDDTKFLWYPDEVTPGEELMILGESGHDDYEDWITAVDRREAVAVQVLVWFLKRQAGVQVDRQSLIFPHRKVDLEKIVDPPEADAVSTAAPEPSDAATSSPS